MSGWRRPAAAMAAVAALLVVELTASGRQAGRGRDLQDAIRNLRHPDPKARVSAVEALGNAGAVEAIDAVAPLVVDSDDRVQFAAIDAELLFFLIDPIGGRRVLTFGGSGS